MWLSFASSQTQHVGECLKYLESDASLNLTPKCQGAAISSSWNLNVFADPGVSGTLCQMLLKAASPAYFHLNGTGLYVLVCSTNKQIICVLVSNFFFSFSVVIAGRWRSGVDCRS